MIIPQNMVWVIYFQMVQLVFILMILQKWLVILKIRKNQIKIVILNIWKKNKMKNKMKSNNTLMKITQKIFKKK